MCGRPKSRAGAEERVRGQAGTGGDFAWGRLTYEHHHGEPKFKAEDIGTSPSSSPRTARIVFKTFARSNLDVIFDCRKCNTQVGAVPDVLFVSALKRVIQRPCPFTCFCLILTRGSTARQKAMQFLWLKILRYAAVALKFEP